MSTRESAVAIRRAPIIAGFRDTMAVAWRNLIGIKRVPQLLVFTAVQPVIFVLLFRYVFGGAVRSIPGIPYVDYLIPGIFVQTVVFGSIATAIGLAADLQSGLLERFRSLPMARSAVLAGRTTADLVRNAFVVMLLAAVGFAVGFRVHTNPIAFVGGLLLVLLFSYVLSWLFATVGLMVGEPESAQAAAFPIMAPLVFASSVFIPIQTMPSWLQGFAEHQPVSVTASAVRALAIGGETAPYVIQSLAWCFGLLLIFIPLAVSRYRRVI